MSNPMTPEERLLRLIRGDKVKKSEPDGAALASDKDAGKETRPGNQPILKFREKFFGGKKQAVTAVFHPEDLIRHAVCEAPKAHMITTRVLIAALVMVWGHIVWQIFFRGEISYEDSQSDGGKEQPEINSLWSIPRPELSTYLGPVSGRDLFKAFEPEKPSVEVSKGPKLEDIIARMSLIGIILDEKRQAVIQDRKTQATYYAHEGDVVDGVIVEEIKEGVVRFSYQGESFELRI